MKAWVLSDRNLNDLCVSLVFANTRSEARTKYHTSDKMYQRNFSDLEWIHIKCIRAKEFDDMENSTEKEIVLKLVKDYDWCFDIGFKIYDRNNIKELEKFFNK